MTWVFGYGSLIWRPDFPFEEIRIGHIKGFARRFYQGSSDHRGTPEAPGRVVTLLPIPHDRCDGLAYRLPQKKASQILETLDVREKNGYERRLLPFYDVPGHDPSISVLVYLATRENRHYLGPAPLLEMAAQIKQSHGPSGANRDYLLQLASALRRLKLEDPHVFALEATLRSLEHEPPKNKENP